MKKRIAIFLIAAVLCTSAYATPKVVIISLDGATPRIVDQLNASGQLNPNEGINLLRAKGFSALQNVTIAPSLTAPAHIAIATGSIAAANDVLANTFHLVASPFTFNISGFSAPIGGYLAVFDGRRIKSSSRISRRRRPLQSNGTPSGGRPPLSGIRDRSKVAVHRAAQGAVSQNAFAGLRNQHYEFVEVSCRFAAAVM